MEETMSGGTQQPSNKSAMTIIIVVIIAILAIGAYALMRNNSSNNNAMMNDTAAVNQDNNTAVDNNATTNTNASVDNNSINVTTDTNTVKVPPMAETKNFTVEAANFSFSPSTITVNKGDKIKITLNNTEGNHDLVIDEFTGARTNLISAGQTASIEFVADKSGTFEYYCSFGSHRAMGMKGSLIVK